LQIGIQAIRKHGARKKRQPSQTDPEIGMFYQPIVPPDLWQIHQDVAADYTNKQPF
jgi:hypothetical protein